MQLRPEFLMEMMDLNEAMAMADGEDEKDSLRKQIEGIRQELLEIVSPALTPLIRTAMNRNSARLSTSTTSNGI